ncbi:MAG TPA: glycosyltransferase [Candidatus Nitrosotalea sp.]|nr:glycosyltransferase [Candidatus Nitrosotalea sp.]
MDRALAGDSPAAAPSPLKSGVLPPPRGAAIGRAAGPMRIALVTETWLPARNGVVTRLTKTLDELARRGHEVSLLAPRGCEQGSAARIHLAPALRLPFVYGGQPWGLPWPRVASDLGSPPPDLVHVVNPVLLGWSGIRLARRLRVPLVCSYHARVDRYAHFYHLGFAARPARALIARAHRLATVNLATSASAAAEVAALTGGPVGIWRGAVDFDLFQPGRASPALRRRLDPSGGRRHLLLYVGRLAAEKGIENLVELARQDDLHLCLVGDGPHRPALERAFAGTHSSFMGSLQGVELAAAYASGDLLLSPSGTETLGLGMLEARACGVPVLAQRSGVSEEVLGGAPGTETTAFEDRSAALAAVRRALVARPSRDDIASDARRRVPGWREVTGELVDHYRSALERSARVRAA